MYWHLKQTDQTLHLSRQAHLVRLGLSIAELGYPRRGSPARCPAVFSSPPCQFWKGFQSANPV